MKRIRNIIAITLSIIILTNSTLSYTTVCASPQLPSTSISIIKAQDRAFTVKWKKKSNITGYQIQYSTNSKFKKGNKSIKIKNAKTVSKKITKLKVAKKYYVRVRTYKLAKKNNLYSSWSKKKCVTTKSSTPISTAATTTQAHCTNNNNHSIKCGNMGRWFNSRSELVAYYNSEVSKWNKKIDNEEITYDEYYKNVPSGYECWSCSYCGKWTGNFKYN
mgnify:CR=1 FL=1